MKRTCRVAGLLVFALMSWRMFVSSQTRSDPEWSPRLILSVTDEETGRPIAARFSLLVDGQHHEPKWVGAHGVRFVSVHVSRRQTYVVTYARGTGPVEVPLLPEARRVEVRVAKGLDYLPATAEAEVSSDLVRLAVTLRRWNKLREQGWRAADAHIHYDRVEPAGDRDFFHMMDGDGLSHAQFMVLKGGMVPGVWAQQFAYGKRGEGADGERLIVPGEEYRDQLQGHLLLFGLGDLIQPIMAGVEESPENWPAFVDLLERARRSGGMVGAAHGGTLNRSPTVVVDAVLGAMDFMEIGNPFLWRPYEYWYPLMNCGFILPPTAGTDLPNVPYRDGWQPFLGSIRTYVKVGDRRGSDAWNEAVKRGEVFVTSGPIIRLSVNGAGPGGIVKLPAGGGEVEIVAELSSPRELRALEVVRNGAVIESAAAGGTRLAIRKKLRVERSCWLAARGVGARIEAINQDAVAHTAAVRVLVGGEPIRSPEDAAKLIAHLRKQKEFYRDNGTYARQQHRERALKLFDEAIAALRTGEPGA